MTSGDEELSDQQVWRRFENQIIPQLVMAEIKAVRPELGGEVYQVNRHIINGYEITCSKCGAVSRARKKPPSHALVICPPCAGRLDIGDIRSTRKPGPPAG